MNLNDYYKKINDLKNEIDNINFSNRMNQYVLNKFEDHVINEIHCFTNYLENNLQFYVDSDLLINVLEQQKEKNEARLNEIKQEISKLQKEDIQL